MFRFLCLVLLGLVLVQGSGLAFAGGEDRCLDRCAGEQKDGQCPPDCDLCGCCSGVLPVVITQIALPASPARSGVVVVEPVPWPSMPDPREITHIPLALS